MRICLANGDGAVYMPPFHFKHVPRLALQLGFLID